LPDEETERGNSGRTPTKVHHLTGHYPGAGKCPPDDVGGTHGYAEFLRTIRDVSNPERDSMLRWAGGQFDPEAFRAADIRFEDLKERWRIAFTT